MSEPYIGQITLFAGTFAPRGWAFCDGALLAIATNSALFAILGTTYGGNGTTTFALPDLRGRVPVHVGNGSPGPGLSPYVLGEQTGTETVTLLITEIPAHNHFITADASPGANESPSGGNLAETTYVVDQETILNSTYTTGTPKAPVLLNPTTITPAGGNQSHANIQPVLALNYIIALQGIFPSRN